MYTRNSARILCQQNIHNTNLMASIIEIRKTGMKRSISMAAREVRFGAFGFATGTSIMDKPNQYLEDPMFHEAAIHHTGRSCP